METSEFDGMYRSIIRFNTTHRRRCAALLRQAGLYQGQPRILGYLMQHDGCIQRELATLCHLQPASVTSVLVSMERAGMIERRSNPDDRRTLQVFLTDIGREKYRCAEQVLKSVDQEAFHGFTPKEIELAARIFQRITDNLLLAEADGHTQHL